MREGLERTRVWFNRVSRAQFSDYIDRENVMDKAGAYAIQGFASVYIPKIEGSYSNVIGLPLAMVWDLLPRSNLR
jgi:septum formation protein